MSRAFRCIAAVALLLAVGCSGPEQQGERSGATRSPIAYGTLDAIHTAVAAVLSPVSSNEFQECTGSIVAVAGGQGYVLTAAHCCNSFVPTVVVASNDYSIGEAALGGATPVAPVYGVVAGSVYYDAQYDGAGHHDFCMLKFAGATGGLATLALPASSSDGLQIGSNVEHIGFGITDTTNNNSQRRTAIDTVDLQLTNLLIEFSQGGASHIPGTCAGDSGGPTLLPAGVAQAQQVIVGVQSFGNSTSCAGGTLGGASRVTSAIGSGQFISSYLAGTPIGVNAGGSQMTSAPVGGAWMLVVLGAALVTTGRQRLAGALRRLQGWSSATAGAVARPSFVFVAKFGASALALLGIYYFPYAQGSAPRGWIDGWLHFTAASAGFLLHLLANDVHVYGDEIVGHGFAMRIVRTCDAADVMILLSSAVLAWPGRWGRRVRVALAGNLVVYGLNVVRIVTLFGLGARHPDAFEFAHLELWPIVLLIAALAVFYWQARSQPLEAAR